jgi:predicted  nucleic acid-binding Zn-ribbon protein
MFSRYIEVAAAKASSEEERESLRAIQAAASRLDEQERTFEARINASKAARGEGPTKLSKAKRREVDQYAADAAEMADEQLRTFSALDHAREVITALHGGLRADVRFWSKAPDMAHPSDRPIVEEFTLAKKDLLAAMSAYLQKFAGGA